MTDIQYPVVLRVDFVLRKQARATGAQWNKQKRQWEARTPAALFKCRKWTHQRLGGLWKREWLDVPYSQRNRAKMYNARYDAKYKCWYDPYGSASESAAGLNPYRLRRHSQYQW
jgi:Domain of unknown function (DUF5710)